MSGLPNAAILFEPSAFDDGGSRIMGRHVAGANFLNGFVRHAAVDRYVGIGFNDSHAPHFRRQVAAAAGDDPALSARPVAVHNLRDLSAISEVGTMFVPDPQIARFASRRRMFDQRAYSLCGITHTIASSGVMGMLCDLLTDPVQSWDALICTSQSVRQAVLRQQEHYADYIEQRIGKRPFSPVQAPVIPLGVDVDRFERMGSDGAARAALRQRLGAGDGDVVVLFLGRLAFHAKAHPVPMYLGAQRVARRLGPEHGRIHLVLTGQFPNKVAEDCYRDGAESCCPDVAVHFLDGSDRWVADASWAAADLFASLSDNVQESFGITPVEAMAAGLPCLVSDWDGYRDTVLDGETGIRVPTWMPTRGNGAAIADAYGMENLTYDLYVGYASQMTAVEVPAFGDALQALVCDRALRQRMGEAGRRRARALYDWRVIVRAYQELWAELAERRRGDREIAPPRPQARNPRLVDPFDVFVGHASELLRNGCSVRVDPDAPALDVLLAMPGNVFAASAMLDSGEVAELIQRASGRGCTLASILSAVAPARRVRTVRSVAWLAKYGVLTLQRADAEEG